VIVKFILKSRIGQVLSFAGPIATLAINPWGNFDPISVVKLVVITGCSFLIAGLAIPEFKSLTSSVDKHVLMLSGLFVGWMLIVILFSGAPITQQVWGIFGRNTGFLAYLSLIILLVSAAILKESSIYEKVFNSLIATSIPMTIYCFVQYSGNDPIGWSLYQTFGTLGNINFLSAFLGLTCIANFAYIISSNSKPILRSCLLLLMLCQLFLVNSTGSIQGIFVFAAGSVIAIILKLATNSKLNLRQVAFTLFVFASLVPIGLGLVNRGPLSAILFQTSTALRADYWHAGYQMMIDKPIFGVGMDSYGDWYREVRGEITASRGVDRTTNTAHNIFLDIGSNGGFLLLFLYILLQVLAIKGAIRRYRLLNGLYDPIFAGIFSVWIGYQVQALVSINQLGVGVWGWIFTGVLIGLGNITTNEASQGGEQQKRTRKNVKRKSVELLPTKIFLSGFATFSLGLILVWFPWKADAEHLAALKSGSADRIMESTNMIGATAFHIDRIANNALAKEDYANVNLLAHKVIDRFPRDFFAWKVLLISPLSDGKTQAEALNVLQRIDPFNPEFMRP
jgi:O-antigen ligase